MNEQTTEQSATWGIVEIMGYVKVAGRVADAPMFGTTLCRVDIPQADGSFVTQYFGGSSIYRFTPSSEEAARAAAQRFQPQPVHQFQLSQLRSLPPDRSNDYGHTPEDEEFAEDAFDEDDEELPSGINVAPPNPVVYNVGRDDIPF